MARSRTIKPAFYLNEHLAQKSPYARLLFVGLWCLADFKGRLEDRPMRIKAALLPYEQIDVDALLDELAQGPDPFIARYQVQGCRYIEILNFSKHQNPSTKEKQAGSQIPPMPLDYLSGTLPGRSGDVTGSDLGHDGDVTGTYPAQPITYYPLPSTSHTLPDSDASASACVSDENKKFAKAGFDYLLSLSHPNFSCPTWVTGYLGLQFQKLEQVHPQMTKEDALTIWRDLCDVATNGNNKITSPNWFKKVFPDKLDSWTPGPAKTFLPEPASGESLAEKTRELLTFPFIQHSITGQLFKSEELEIRPESPNGLTDSRNNYYPCGHLQGLTEVPA